MEKKPENYANKVDIAVMAKEKKIWLLIEGMVCSIGLISDRWKTKQDKRAGIRHQSQPSKCSFRFPSRISPEPEERSQSTFNRKERRRGAIFNNEEPKMDHITKR